MSLAEKVECALEAHLDVLGYDGPIGSGVSITGVGKAAHAAIRAVLADQRELAGYYGQVGVAFLDEWERRRLASEGEG